MQHRKQKVERYTYKDLKGWLDKIKKLDPGCLPEEIPALVKRWTPKKLKEPLPVTLNAMLKYIAGHYSRAAGMHLPQPTLTDDLCKKPGP